MCDQRCPVSNAHSGDTMVTQGELATIGTTMQTTAILEAGRISLDSGNRTVKILYEDEKAVQPCGLE